MRQRRRTALLAVGTLTVGLLLTTPQSASAANLIKNPGFETAGSGDMPYCWSKSGWGDNDFTFETVSDAHSGSKAMKVELTRRTEGDRVPVVIEGRGEVRTVEVELTRRPVRDTQLRADAAADIFARRAAWIAPQAGVRR